MFASGLNHTKMTFFAITILTTFLPTLCAWLCNHSLSITCCCRIRSNYNRIIRLAQSSHLGQFSTTNTTEYRESICLTGKKSDTYVVIFATWYSQVKACLQMLDALSLFIASRVAIKRILVVITIQVTQIDSKIMYLYSAMTDCSSV